MSTRLIFFSESPEPQVTRYVRDNGSVGWQLVAANNRPIGRAAHSSVSLAACLESLRLLRDAAVAGGLQPRLTSTGQTWAWVVLRGSESVAVSAKRYSRRSECERSLRHFLAGVAALALAAGDECDVRVIGSRMRRVFAAPREDAA